jgi:hypothetical protein
MSRTADVHGVRPARAGAHSMTLLAQVERPRDTDPPTVEYGPSDRFHPAPLVRQRWIGYVWPMGLFDLTSLLGGIDILVRPAVPNAELRHDAIDVEELEKLRSGGRR